MQAPSPDLSDVTIRASDLLPFAWSLAGTVVGTGVAVALWLRRELSAFRTDLRAENRDIRTEIRDVWTTGIDPLRTTMSEQRERTATLTTRLDVAKETTRLHSPHIVFPQGAEERNLLWRWGNLADILDMPTEDLDVLRASCDDIMNDSARGLDEKANTLSVLRQIKDELVVRESRSIDIKERFHLLPPLGEDEA